MSKPRLFGRAPRRGLSQMIHPNRMMRTKKHQKMVRFGALWGAPMHPGRIVQHEKGSLCCKTLHDDARGNWAGSFAAQLPGILCGCFLCFIVISTTGCGVDMEDGYKPRSLSNSPTQRRAYYASPFTPEAEAGKDEKSGPAAPGRPSFGGGY